MLQLADACRRSLGAEQRHRHQIHHALGRVAEAIHDLVQQLLGFFLCADVRHAAVEIHPLLAGGHIGLGDVGGDGQVCRTLRLLAPFLAPFFQNGIFQQFQIHIIAHGHHVARLLRAQQIAGAPDLQIPHGDFEAGAEFGKFPDGLQPLFGDVGEDFALPEGQIGKGVSAGTAHTAADLMQLGKAQLVGILDDQGVDIGNINTRLNDGGADQNLDFPVCHALHDVGKLLLIHFAVGSGYFHIAQPVFQPGGGLLDALRAVVQVVDLPAPVQLPADGVIQQPVIVLQHEGLHRVAVTGRLFDGGHVPQTGERHVQRSGDGRCRQGQDIHTHGKLLQPLLVGDAEPLLLVHDQKSQILELNAFLQQLVGANDHIHLAGGQVVEGLFLLRGGAEPAQHIDVHGVSAEPLHGGGIVLLGQHSGGHQNGHLLAVQYGLHGGAKGHFRLAEAHVAAEQPVHGRGAFHILFDLGDAAELIVGFRVFKAVLKLALPWGVGGEGVAGQPLPGGIELNEPCRQILGGGLGLGLGFLPGIAGELVQSDGGVLTAANILAHQIQLGGGHIEHVAALIGDFYIVLGDAAHLHLLHVHIPADAVVLVDHQIAGRKVGEGVELLPVGGLGFFCRAGFPSGLGGHQLAFRHHRQLQGGVLQTGGQTAIGQQDLTRLRQLDGGEGHGGMQSLLLQQSQQDLGPAAVAAEHQGAELILPVILQIGDGCLHGAAVGGQLLAGNAQDLFGRQGLRIGCRQEAVQKHRGPSRKAFAQGIKIGVQVAQVAAELTGLQKAVQLQPKVFLPGLGGPLERAVVAEQHHGVPGNIIAGGGKFRIDQCHIPVCRREGNAVFQLFHIRLQGVDEGFKGVLAPLLPGDERADVGAQAGDALGMQPGGSFGNREQGGFVDIFRPPLGDGVEEAHGVQFIAPELGPDGLIVGGRVDVQNTAADGKLSHTLDQGGAGIAGIRQFSGKILQFVGRAALQGNGGGKQHLLRHSPQTQGVQGRHQQLRLADGQIVQLPQPLLLPAAGDYGGIVEGELPGGQHSGGFAQKGSQLLCHPLGSHVVLTDHQSRAARPGVQRRHHMAAGQLAHAGQGADLPLLHGIYQSTVFRKIIESGKQ